MKNKPIDAEFGEQKSDSYRLTCFGCGKTVSNDVPTGFVVRGTTTCPECEVKAPQADPVTLLRAIVDSQFDDDGSEAQYIDAIDSARLYLERSDSRESSIALSQVVALGEKFSALMGDDFLEALRFVGVDIVHDVSKQRGTSPGSPAGFDRFKSITEGLNAIKREQFIELVMESLSTNRDIARKCWTQFCSNRFGYMVSRNPEQTHALFNLAVSLSS